MVTAWARVMFSLGRKVPSVKPWTQPSATARSISSSAQWPAMSVRLLRAVTSLWSNREQMAANSARVMGASGSNRPELWPLMTPRAAMVEIAVLAR